GDAAIVGGDDGIAAVARAPVLQAAEPVAGRRRLRCVAGTTLCAVLSRQSGSPVDSAGRVLSNDSGRLLRRHLVAARHRLAMLRQSLAGRVLGLWPDRGDARPLVADARRAAIAAGNSRRRV